MKNFTRGALVAAILFVPVCALGDQAPPSPGQGPPGGFEFQQVREQVDKARTQARATMLGALSPAHRNLLAQVVGGLAIAQTPDVDAAAKTLDGALSPGEAKKIIDTSNALDAQIKQIIDAARQQNGGEGGPAGTRNRMYAGQEQGTPDAGTILLRSAVPPMGPPIFLMRTVGPPPGQ